MLDADPAKPYGATIAHLNKAVPRNRGRFPEDFLFSLTLLEASIRPKRLIRFHTHKEVFVGNHYPP
jgi:hypothetical protein